MMINCNQRKTENNEYLQNMTVEDMITLHNLGKDIILNDGQVIAVV
jgi:hypothetical protein